MRESYEARDYSIRLEMVRTVANFNGKAPS